MGGLGGPVLLRAVLGEEVAARDLAQPGYYSMIEVLAPTMISYARRARRRDACRCCSAARSTGARDSPSRLGQRPRVAVRRRPHARATTRIVTGQKVWTSLAQLARRCVLLPGPPRGTLASRRSSWTWTPPASPSGLRTMHGVDEFAEVFLTVVVPGHRMLGRPGDGWRSPRTCCRRALHVLLAPQRVPLRAAGPAARPRLRAAVDAAGPRPPSGGVPRPVHDALPVREPSTGLLKPGPWGRRRRWTRPPADRRAAAVRHRARPPAGRGELDDSPWRAEYLYPGGHHLRRHRRDPAQHHRPSPAGPRGRDDARDCRWRQCLQQRSVDPEELGLLAATLRKTMTSTASGSALHAALAKARLARDARRDARGGDPAGLPPAGRDRGARAVLADVVLAADGLSLPADSLPWPDGLRPSLCRRSWVVWERDDVPGDHVSGTAMELPVRRVPAGAARSPAALAAGRVAVGWWLLGSGRAMLTLARQHAVDRVQFGQPIASFQAVRHKLADTLVALDGAEAVLRAAGD